MDISGKGRYRQGLDALASRGGSIAWAWLAVVWCPLLGVPVVSRLALLTPRALCVVLATLKGQSMVRDESPEATSSGPRSHQLLLFPAWPLPPPVSLLG